MSHSFQAMGMNIKTPHRPIRARVRRRMDRLEWLPRVAAVGVPAQLSPCSYLLLPAGRPEGRLRGPRAGLRVDLLMKNSPLSP